MFGVAEGDRYVNAYFGIDCQLGDGWSLADQEELLALQGMAGRALEEFDGDYAEYYEQLLEDSTMCYVMAAYSDDQTQNINILVEHLDGVDGLIDEEDLLDLVMDQIGDTLDGAGITATPNTFTLGGEEHPGLALRSVTSVGNLQFDVSQQMVLILKGDYALQITMTSTMDDSGDGIAAMADFFAAD